MQNILIQKTQKRFTIACKSILFDKYGDDLKTIWFTAPNLINEY